MSLNIRYLTNGKRSIYKVDHSDTGKFEVYENRDDIPKEIRHYTPTGEPKFVGPGAALWFGAADILYPGFPRCQHPNYKGERCIAEDCKFADDTAASYRSCPYFDSRYKEQ